VSTRKLIAVAMIAGLAILLAGGIQLVLLATRDDATTTALSLGDDVAVGGVDITVQTVDRLDSGDVEVDVALGAGAGEDDLDGLALIGSNGDLVPRGDITCADTCTVTFEPDGLDVSGPLTVVYGRGDERASWAA
jgi:hypothetical protein